MSQSALPLPFTALNAVTATGAGASRDLEKAFATFDVLLFTTGSPTTVTVVLEGSHDGTNWYQIGNPAITLSTPHQLITGYVFRYVRANLITLTGGSSPTVTATVAVL